MRKRTDQTLECLIKEHKMNAISVSQISEKVMKMTDNKTSLIAGVLTNTSEDKILNLNEYRVYAGSATTRALVAGSKSTTDSTVVYRLGLRRISFTDIFVSSTHNLEKI